MSRGIFITFEGIDGCGKSSLLHMLVRYIWDSHKYSNFVLTREPYKDKDIRKFLSQDSDPYSRAEKLAEMFVSDRILHVSELIKPNLARGIHVLSDRYDLSTICYQHTQGIEIKTLIDMHKRLPVPDITYIVDVPAETAIKRMKLDGNRKFEQKFEKDLEFLEKLRENYLKMFDLMPERNIELVDNRKSRKHAFESFVLPSYEELWP